MCVDYDDGDEPLADAFRRARKEHKCYACRETIRKGDRYHYIAQVFDGELCTFKHCLRCWAMLGEIMAVGDGAVQYDLHCGTSWQEAFDGDPPDDVAALAFLTPDEAQQRLRDGD